MTEYPTPDTPEQRLEQSAGSLIKCWNEYRDAYIAGNLSDEAFDQAKFELPYVKELHVNYQTPRSQVHLEVDIDRSVIVEDTRVGSERELRFRIVSNREEDGVALLDQYQIAVDADERIIDIQLGYDLEGLDKLAELVTSAHLYGERHGFQVA